MVIKINIYNPIPEYLEGIQSVKLKIPDKTECIVLDCK